MVFWPFPKKKYINTVVSLHWIKYISDPQARFRVKDKLQILINDKSGTHKSLEVTKLYYKNEIILCSLPYYTSHKLQPCDVGALGPLKTAYWKEVERLYRLALT